MVQIRNDKRSLEEVVVNQRKQVDECLSSIKVLIANSNKQEAELEETRFSSKMSTDDNDVC